MNNWFFVFFLDFDKKNLCFCRKFFWQGCQKYFRRVQWNTYRANFRNGSLENSRIFEKFSKFLGQCWKNLSRVGKTAIDVRGNSLWKFFSKEKNSLFFPILCECLLPAKNFARVAKTAICVSVEVFGEKHSLKYIYNLSHFFRTLIHKTLSGKENFFPGRHNCNPRVQRHFLRKSTFFKKSFIRSSVLEFEEFFLSIDKK